MSSTSPLQVIVYDSPEHEHSAVCHAIKSFDLATDWGLPGGRISLDKQVSLHLGDAYGTHHAPLGTSDQLAARPRTDAPDSTFLLWQGPYFEEADGHYVAYAPGVGGFESACSANGAPHISLPVLMASLNKSPDLTTAQWLAGPGDSILGTRVREVIAATNRRGPNRPPPAGAALTARPPEHPCTAAGRAGGGKRGLRP